MWDFEKILDSAVDSIVIVAGKRDITQEVVLQKQVQTAQRMESVAPWPEASRMISTTL